MQKNITSNLIFTNEQIAINYGLTTGLTIAKHLRMHNDEFIENTHYFLVENSFKNKTIKWTLEGVYKLFDKIKKLKERNKMAEEKESKGSYNLQIKIPNELKDKLEKKAEKAGVSLNQYIMYLFIDDIKNERI
ncbi:TPA: toxin-antitoxin system HicB family antitoxin [Campylobacter coli]|uniref:toxin-antitoxin system HicB family antitoxin n=1 Tax=Campylobacter coli TaxID=195 RepID=UPI000AD149BA|nr:toxin-antitoxin system HicB family antitoxin [Campylobacter coli]